MNFRIPDRFQMANRNWVVKWKESKNYYGKTEGDKARITLAHKMSSELVLQTFLHELLHAAAGTMGWDKVNSDEHRIDALAALLAQAIQTAE
jgi:hypothetical protein